MLSKCFNLDYQIIHSKTVNKVSRMNIATSVDFHNSKYLFCTEDLGYKLEKKDQENIACSADCTIKYQNVNGIPVCTDIMIQKHLYFNEILCSHYTW